MNNNLEIFTRELEKCHTILAQEVVIIDHLKQILDTKLYHLMVKVKKTDAYDFRFETYSTKVDFTADLEGLRAIISNGEHFNTSGKHKDNLVLDVTKANNRIYYSTIDDVVFEVDSTASVEITYKEIK